MFGSQHWEDDEHVSERPVTPEQKSVSDVDFANKGWKPKVKFIVAFLTGAFVFLFPVQWEGQTTIPLDVMMTLIQNASLLAVELFALGVILAGGILTTISELHYRGTITVGDRTKELLELDYWQTANVFWAFRVLAVFSRELSSSTSDQSECSPTRSSTPPGERS